MATVKINYSGEIAEYRRRISVLLSEIASLKKNIYSLKTKCNELKSFRDSLNENFANFMAELDDVRKKVSNIRYRYSSIDTSLRKLSNINSGIRDIIVFQKNEITVSKNSVDSFLTIENNQLLDAIKSNENDISQKEAQILTLNNKIASLGGTV